MDKYQETFTTWNKVALLYEQKFMDLDIYNPSYDVFCSTIEPANAKVIDIGCGPGNITRYIMAQRPDFDVLGIDIAPKMIALAKKNIPNANFTVMDSRDIGKLSTKFDGIICGFCLPYLSPGESDQLIADASILLQNNGCLYLSFVEGKSDESGYQTSSTGDRVFFNFHTLEVVKNTLTNNGFCNIKVMNVTYHKTETVQEIHTIIIATKSTTISSQVS